MGRENRMNAVNEISVPPHSDYHIKTGLSLSHILLTYQKLTSYVYVYM